jgi:hypothetical protein
VLVVVQGRPYDHTVQRYLHLSTTWSGRKIATRVHTLEDALDVEKNCSWTIVDGSDWMPINNFTVGAASPSTPWKGFLKASCLKLCMPLWPLNQLQDCLRLTSSDITDDKLETLNENYELIGGIARWAFGTRTSVVEQVTSAVLGIDFERLQTVMTTRLATLNDAKEVAHRLVEWSTPIDTDGKQTYIVTDETPFTTRCLPGMSRKNLPKMRPI